MSNERQKPNIVTDPDKFTPEERRAHLERRLESDPEMARLVARLGELPTQNVIPEPETDHTA